MLLGDAKVLRQQRMNPGWRNLAQRRSDVGSGLGGIASQQQSGKQQQSRKQREDGREGGRLGDVEAIIGERGFESPRGDPK